MNGSPSTLRVRRQQQTRTDIIRVAFDLFGKHGFEKVSVPMIAAAAGVSRATFFNYFPKKELLLREVAQARVEKLKGILGTIGAPQAEPTFDSVVQIVLNLSEENARISMRSKNLLLETIFHQASQGLLLTVRDQAIESLTLAIDRIPRRKGASAKLIAETLFAIYIATMLEWLMRRGVPQQWLLQSMRKRLSVLVKGVA